MAKRPLINYNSLLSLSLGAYFLLLGIQGIANYNSAGGEVLRAVNSFLGSSSSVISLITAVLQIGAGIVLVLGPFNVLSKGIQSLANLVIMGLWIFYLVWSLFLSGSFSSRNILPWLVELSHGLVVLFAITVSRDA